MNTVQAVHQDDSRRMHVIWLATGLAVLAALSYVLIQLGVLGVGDLQPAEEPAAIVFVAASCYLLGGFLIVARRRWLWTIGAVINALVILFFIMAYLSRPAVMFSPGGLATKTAQALLEVCLLYLIVTAWRRPGAQAR